MKMVRKVAWLAVFGLVAYLVYGYYMTGVQETSRPGGPFTLTSHTGDKVSDTDFRGKFMLIYFGYSYCPDVCRIELHKLTVALEQLEEQGYDISPLQPVFISVDPERDTVAELADFVVDYHPSLIALTGTLEEIGTVAKDYRVYYKKRIQEGVEGYLMDHQSFIFVMDQDGDYNRLFSAKDTPTDIAGVFAQVLDKKDS